MNINADAARDIPCKNILIYGYCKFENKGCAFSHNAPDKSANSSKASTLKSTASASSKSSESSRNATAEAKRRFNTNTPSFQPSVANITNKFAGLLPKVKEIPIFVPSPTPVPPKGESKEELGGRKFNASTPLFTPSFEGSLRFSGPDTSFGSQPQSPAGGNLQLLMQSHQIQPPMPAPAIKQQNPYLPGNSQQQQPSNADFMFHHNQGAQAYTLNYHLYLPAPPPRLTVPLNMHLTNVNDMFIPNDLRELLTKKNEATLQTLAQLSLPEHVGLYHSLVPIDTTFDLPSKVYNVPSFVYKVISNANGLPYVIRRLDYAPKMRILNELPFRTVKKWKALQNPNVVGLHDAFTSVAFGTLGEPTLCLAYDYYPLANTLQEQHLTRKLGSKLEPITEDVLWAYLVQITGALLAIHEAGLHAGSTLGLSKILVTNKNRIRLGGVCVDDILDYEALEKRSNDMGQAETLRALHLADYRRFGKVILELASATLPISLRNNPLEIAITNLAHSSTVNFSNEFLIALRTLNLVDKEFDLATYYTQHLAQRALKLLNGLQDLTDYYEGQLSLELENGRLFRLMAKINFLAEKLDKENDNGNFFVIRLFRDFVFQAHDEFGKPVADLLKVLVNMNKLDAGTEEKILLISADEESCIIVSYKEVRDILDLTFRAVYR